MRVRIGTPLSRTSRVIAHRRSFFSSIFGNKKKPVDTEVIPINEKGPRVYSWGSQGFLGQLGHGDAASYPSPKLITRLGNISQVSCGLNHVLAITPTGKAFSWGSNHYMQLGNSRSGEGLISDGEQLHPEMLKEIADLKIKAVKGGYWHSVALTESGVVYVWGNGYHGQLGIGQDWNVADPVQVREFKKIKTEISDVSCGATHSCAVTPEGILYAWGSNAHGQLGRRLKEDNQKAERPVAVNIRGSKDGEESSQEKEFHAKLVRCGALHTTVVTVENDVYSLGNGNLKLSNPLDDPYTAQSRAVSSKEPSFKPIRVSENVKFKDIQSGNNITALVTDTGELWIWSCDDLRPVRVNTSSFLSSTKIEKVAIGITQIAVITDSGELWIWGLDELHAPKKATKLNTVDSQQALEVSVGWDFGVATFVNKKET